MVLTGKHRQQSLSKLTSTKTARMTPVGRFYSVNFDRSLPAMSNLSSFFNRVVMAGNSFLQLPEILIASAHRGMFLLFALVSKVPGQNARYLG
jgi:hypothetical protein